MCHSIKIHKPFLIGRTSEDSFRYKRFRYLYNAYFRKNIQVRCKKAMYLYKRKNED